MAPDEKESWSAHVAAVDNLFASIPDIITRLEDEIRRILGVD
jgi:hypothetical protein